MKKRKMIIVSDEWHKRIEKIAERLSKERERNVTMTEVLHEAMTMYVAGEQK